MFIVHLHGYVPPVTDYHSTVIGYLYTTIIMITDMIHKTNSNTTGMK